MRLVFPCVTGDTARGVRLLTHVPSPLERSHQARLGQKEIEALELGEVPKAVIAMKLRVQLGAEDWAIDWRDGTCPPINGTSAQLAALVALVDATAPDSISPRGWLKNEEIWLTGAIDVPDAPLEPTVRATVEEEDTDRLKLKLAAFLESMAPVLICASKDADQLAKRAGKMAVVITAQDLARLLQRRSPPARKYIVAVPPSEINFLLDALFQGLFPRGIPVLIANAITAVRLVCAAFVAYSLWHGDFLPAAVFYVVGLLTDVADGAFARAFQGTSEFGKQFDRIVDMIFNAVSGIGYAAGAGLVWGTVLEAVALLALTGGVMVTSRWWIQPRWRIRAHSGLAKLRSGWIRTVVLGFLCFRLNWQFSPIWVLATSVVGLALLGIAVYEIDLVRREVAAKKRGWFSSTGERSGE